MKAKIFKAFFFLFAFFSLLLGQAWRTCIRVIDGDTIVLDGGEKVRLIGIDAPEPDDSRETVQILAENSYKFVKSTVEGKRVRLEYDQNRTDVYDRTLAYVFLEDGVFLNALIIQRGYGSAYTKYPFKYMEEFRGYERAARTAGIGLWTTEDKLALSIKARGQQAISASDSITVYITRTGKKYHKGSCSSLSKSKIPISLKEACDKGYSPCARCKPPACK